MIKYATRLRDSLFHRQGGPPVLLLVVGSDAFGTKLIRRSAQSHRTRQVGRLEQPSTVLTSPEVTAVASTRGDVDHLARLKRGRLHPLPGIGHPQASDVAIAGPAAFYWIEHEAGPHGRFSLQHASDGLITTIYTSDGPLAHLTLSGPGRTPVVMTTDGQHLCLRLGASRLIPLRWSGRHPPAECLLGLVGSVDHHMVAIGLDGGRPGVIWDLDRQVAVKSLPSGWRPLAWRNQWCLLAEGARLFVVDVGHAVTWELPSAPEHVFAAAWET